MNAVAVLGGLHTRVAASASPNDGTGSRVGSRRPLTSGRQCYGGRRGEQRHEGYHEGPCSGTIGPTTMVPTSDSRRGPRQGYGRQHGSARVGDSTDPLTWSRYGTSTRIVASRSVTVLLRKEHLVPTLLASGVVYQDLSTRLYAAVLGLAPGDYGHVRHRRGRARPGTLW